MLAAALAAPSGACAVLLLLSPAGLLPDLRRPAPLARGSVPLLRLRGCGPGPLSAPEEVLAGLLCRCLLVAARRLGFGVLNAEATVDGLAALLLVQLLPLPSATTRGSNNPSFFITTAICSANTTRSGSNGTDSRKVAGIMTCKLSNTINQDNCRNTKAGCNILWRLGRTTGDVLVTGMPVRSPDDRSVGMTATL